MQTPFSGHWQTWTIRLAGGAATLLILVWLLAPGIRGFLQSAAVADTDRQFATWLHAASNPLVIEGMRGVSLVHGIAGVLCMTAIAAAVLGWRGEWAALPTLIASVGAAC